MIVEKEKFENASQKAKIICQCDYCGVIFERLKHNIKRSWRVLETDSCPNKVCIQKKRVKSNLELFGTENPFENEDIKKKIIEANIEKYGVSNVMHNEDIKKKRDKTIQEIYNCDNVFSNEVIKDKIKATNRKNLGVDNPTQNADVRKKQQDTLESKTGVRHALQHPDYRQKAMETCINNYGYFPVNRYGATQKEIEDWLNSFGFNFKSNRNLIKGKEIDLYDQNKKLAIEYCGLHWHHEFSPEPRLKNYHFYKHKQCLEQGIQLITIFSDEWEKRKNQCKSHIKSILGINDARLFARKCEIKEIQKEEGRDFFEKYHIQGANSLGIVFFGIFHRDELCGAISLGRHNRQYSNLVLDRLCFRDGIQIVGGASRLFSHCVKWAKSQGKTEIISFSDNRWSIGRVYEALGFEMDFESAPDYSYVNIQKPNERLSKQSQKKNVTGCPADITEYEWAHKNGLARIWDCGKKRWVFKIE